VILAVKKHIQKELPFLMKSKLLIAVSGGIDSIVLTHLMHQLDIDIALAHVNFNLRASASDKDQVFVEHLGKKLQIPVFVYQADTQLYADEHKISIQMAAREIRYRWFDELLKEEKYDYLLTAHHLDDVVETFFINLMRASGLEGLTGIPKQNGSIVRPLLPFDRDEIVAYAQKHNLKWREDQSNASTKYLRNKIRHELVPALKEINPEYKKALWTSQSYLNESKNLVVDYINFLKPTLLKEEEGLLYIALDKLQQLPNKNALLHELLKEYGFTQWEDVYQLPNAQTGKTIYSKTHFLLKDRASLQLGVLDNKHDKQEKQRVITEFTVNNRNYTISTVSKSDTNISKDANEAYIDKSKIKFPLFVRKWREGDYFYPLGMQGKKKLSDFLIDQKVSRIEKKKIYLLCDAENTIIWVIGKRLDDRFKITETTTEILKITT
jgi:tRNA(Ile)-lysidine synthase